MIAGAAPLVAVCAAVHVTAANWPQWVGENFGPLFGAISVALGVGLLVAGVVALRGVRRGEREVLPQTAVTGLVLFFAYLASIWALLRGAG